MGATRRSRQSWQRAPALGVVLAVSAGIGAESRWPIDLPVELAMTGTLLAAWCGLWKMRRHRAAAICLLLGVSTLGAAWHHLCWSVDRGDHIVCFVKSDPQPVRLRGTIAARPVRIGAPAGGSQANSSESTLLILRDVVLLETARAIPVAGRLQLRVSGPSEIGRVGDTVELMGRLSPPAVALSSHAWNPQEQLRTAGIFAVVQCDEAEAVRVVRPAAWSIAALHDAVRSRAEKLLADQLDSETAALGTALLLGTRTQLAEPVRQAFAETGSTHILAISGANIAILAQLLWFLTRVLGFRRLASCTGVLAGLAAYVCLVDSQPAVIRAAWMVLVVLGGLALGRGTNSLNVMAVAGLGVVLLEPRAIFDVGAQLSFLAVAALCWSATMIRSWQHRREQLVDRASPWRQWLGRRARFVGEAWFMSAAVYAVTAPLICSRFHLLSVSALLVGVVFAPLVVAILWSGYLFLMAGLISATLAAPLGVLFNLGLKALLELVFLVRAMPAGFCSVSGPPAWWLAGFYLAVFVLMTAAFQGHSRWVWRGLTAWLLVGLAVPWIVPPAARMRCSILAVGHGGGVLFECPNGKTLLFDAGQMRHGRRAERVIQQAVWETRRQMLDVAIISHADADHYNALAGLSRSVPIASVCMHPSFCDMRKPGVDGLSDELIARGIDLRAIWEGDKLVLDPDVTVRVLRPARGDHSPHDNENSLVVVVEFAGRRILLTGDLEGPAMESLIRETPLDVDVLLAPHHGSPQANPSRLAAWCRPEWIVVSGGRRGITERLARVYGPRGDVLTTNEHGTVTVEISPNGEMTVVPFVARTEIRTPANQSAVRVAKRK